MTEIDTWYVLVDGTHCDPAEVETGEDGVMKHKNGVAVALRDGGLPLTSGVATKSNKQAARAGRKPARGSSEAQAAADMKPEDQGGTGYITRESKAD